MNRYISKVLALVCICAISVGVVGCDDESSGGGAGHITIDTGQKTISFDVVINRSVADVGSWHLVVYEHGSNGEAAFFCTAVRPKDLYDALVAIGAVAGNNVTPENYSDASIASQGSILAVTFRWNGAPKEYSLQEILIEKDTLAGGGAVGVEIRFSGNYQGEPGTNPSDNTGCMTCLYTCPAGIMSNGRANKALNTVDGEWRYVGNTTVLPADGTTIRITYTLTE